MTTPGKPAVGGTVLRIAAIQSPNFVHGASGWIIRIDGTAEFNSTVIRGQLLVTGADGSQVELFPGTSAEIIFTPASMPAGGQPGLMFTETIGSGPGSQLSTVIEAPAFSGQVPGSVALISASDGGSPVPVTQFQLSVGQISYGLSDVQVFPSGDTSGATDAAAVNLALSLSQSVTLATGTYYVNAPLEIPPGGILAGAGRGQVDADTQTVIKAAAAVDAVICSQGWLEATNTTTQGGIRIAGLMADGNSLATHGVVIQNYSSLITDVYVRSCSGDGIRFDGKSQSGAVAITGSGVNNQVVRCLAEHCARAFATNDPNGIFTDGLLQDCFAVDSTATGGAIVIAFAAGWLIAGNHVYGIPGNGIQLGQTYMTRVVGNYVEQWGTSGTPGTWCAIDAGFTLGDSDEGSGSVIAGNTGNLLSAPGNAASTVVGIGFACDNSNTATVTITGNVMRCAPASGFADAYAEWLGNKGATANLIAVSTGNLYTGNWTALIHQTPNGGTITVTAGS